MKAYIIRLIFVLVLSSIIFFIFFSYSFNYIEDNFEPQIKDTAFKDREDK